jgi:hypothetical protein
MGIEKKMYHYQLVIGGENISHDIWLNEDHFDLDSADVEALKIAEKMMDDFAQKNFISKKHGALRRIIKTW